MRGVPALGNAAIDMLHERMSEEWRIPWLATTYVDETTLPEAHLLKFLVSAHALTRSLESLESTPTGTVTTRFLLEIVGVFVRRGEAGRLSRQQFTPVPR